MESSSVIQSNGNGFLDHAAGQKNGYVNKSVELASNGIITEEILKEEQRLEEKELEEEKLRQQEADKQLALRKEEEEKCFKRLHLLLSRSSIYVQFMAESLKKLEDGKLKKEIREKKRLDAIDRDDGSAKRGVKRKANGDLSPKKKTGSGVNVLDVFKKGNMENIELSEANSMDDASNKEKILKSQPKLLYGAVMRPYQLEGFDWLKTLFENAVNGILADEMGLGKTIQAIALVAHLVEMGVPGPFFICGPLTTVPNWCAEFKRFAPDIPIILYHGDKAEREALRRKILRKVQVKEFRCYPVVITSYQIALNDSGKLRNVHWKMLVVDEAQRIKNFQCKLIQSLTQLNVAHRLLLTGTPLQNDLTELWSLLHFILPEIFNDLKVFQTWFDITRLTQKRGTMEIIAREQEKHIVSTIHQILTPFLLRRTKAEVELDLPPKKEVIVHAPLTPLQQEYYTSTLNHAIRGLLGATAEDDICVVKEDLPKRRSKKTHFFGLESDIPPVLGELSGETNSFRHESNLSVLPETNEQVDLNSEVHLKLGSNMMCLRKICNHPYLVSYPLDDYGGYLVDENLIKTSGKLLVLDCLLSKLKERGHKVLLFSQFVVMLDVIQDYCTFRKYKFCRLDGNDHLAERQEELKAFNEDESIFIFLISTKAGGLGINLVAADTVIVYDSDWNPQNDLQAQDRCHRIGQTRPVVVYRLMVPNTIDERIVEIATAKRKLEKVIIKKGRFASAKKAMERDHHIGVSAEELLELFESSDMKTFVKTDTNDVLSPEEVEKLLDRSDMVYQKR